MTHAVTPGSTRLWCPTEKKYRHVDVELAFDHDGFLLPGYRRPVCPDCNGNLRARSRRNGLRRKRLIREKDSLPRQEIILVV